ncbi:MAG: S-adenosylmethionine-binding domain-containing protein [bacterium]|nr:S-adenosylmethionine-binding domain-containing protein [bacterium]
MAVHDHRNRCSRSTETSVHVGAKWVFTMLRNTHTAHSRKPALVSELIERVSSPPRLELFARSKRDGWTTWGNQSESGPPPFPARSASIPESANNERHEEIYQ